MEKCLSFTYKMPKLIFTCEGVAHVYLKQLILSNKVYNCSYKNIFYVDDNKYIIMLS